MVGVDCEASGAFGGSKRIDFRSVLERKPVEQESLVSVHGPVDAKELGSPAEGRTVGRRVQGTVHGVREGSGIAYRYQLT